MSEAAAELTRICRSLPRRPSPEEVEAAEAVLAATRADEEARLEEIRRAARPDGLPEELFALLQEARTAEARVRAEEQRADAARVVELERRLRVFDELVQRAAELIDAATDEGGGVAAPAKAKELPRTARSKAVVDGLKTSDLQVKFPALKSETTAVSRTDIPEPTKNDSDVSTDKLNLLQVATLIESSAKHATTVLDLRGKLVDQVGWLPDSLGKLHNVIELNLSENRMASLPASIGSLKLLRKLDIHSNQLMELPESFTELANLLDLDLHANRLQSLPKSFGELKNLVNLDLSSNHLKLLPDSIGNLTKLKVLNVETNELEELPYTIGSCTALTELRLDFNQLRGLPEATGRLVNLEVLTLHYNRIRMLPTTMASLSKLRELDVSFNELEAVPESLCLVSSLVKLNVGKNFADLKALPRSIGNLEALEELDISSNQIRVLPDSFRFLERLRVLHADEMPLEVPPREIVKLGAQAVVQYMANLVEARQATTSKSSNTQRQGLGSFLCACFLPRTKPDVLDLAA